MVKNSDTVSNATFQGNRVDEITIMVVIAIDNDKPAAEFRKENVSKKLCLTIYRKEAFVIRNVSRKIFSF